MRNPTNMKLEDFKAYLNNHGINDYKLASQGKEVQFACVFNGCDDDHKRGEEWHLNFNLEKCVYHCNKCSAAGNFVTLQKHFGDYMERKTKRKPSNDELAEKWHKALPEDIRLYLWERGINNDSIEKYKLGYADYMGGHRISIPIRGKDGKIAYFKLRKLPDDKTDGEKYIVYPTGSKMTLYGVDELVDSRAEDVLICEGELDRIVSLQNGVNMPVVTGGGAVIFSEENVRLLSGMQNIYICFDNDATGRAGVERLRNLLVENIPDASIYRITLPYEDDSKADLSDYFLERPKEVAPLFDTEEYAEFIGGAEPIDPDEFKEMDVDDIVTALSSTIEFDDVNKTVLFIAFLLAYTERDQLNVMLSGESSSGKSYLVTEVAKYFPDNDVFDYGKMSATAPYYDQKLKRKDSDGNEYTDLERRILVFLDQPDSSLMANLRSFLSHDNKRTKFSITNKGRNGANSASESYILGFSSVIFCTACMRMDEQELTRCLILSPENSKDKIIAACRASVLKSSNRSQFEKKLKDNINRNVLKRRIRYVKKLHVDNINIESDEYLYTTFIGSQSFIRSRLMRDIDHFTSLVKGLALLNAPFRMRNGVIVATNKDVDEAMKLWNVLGRSMQFGIPPQTLDAYESVIYPAYEELNEQKGLTGDKRKGVTYRNLQDYYCKHFGGSLNLEMYRKNHIPILESAGLIQTVTDEDDKRRQLIVPLELIDD